MSYSHEDVSDQVKEISARVRMHAGALVIPDRVTNKRMIIRCSGRNVANSLVKHLKHNGYPITQAAAGLQSTAYYVEVRFNYPY